MHTRVPFLLVSLAASLALAPAAAAQTASALVQPSSDVFGTKIGNTWIDATKFTLPNTAGSPPLTHQALHYFNSPGAANPVGYFAALDEIPDGALVSQVSCVFRDSSASNNLGFSLHKTQTDLSPTSPISTPLFSVTTSGAPGYSFINIPLAAPETITRLVDDLPLTTYHLRADVSSDTSFSGCMVFWTRQISPAPAFATFTDVPTNAQFFREIEALVASGITAGCTPTQYCPDANVTRRQMAAFFARALGLYWNIQQ